MRLHVSVWLPCCDPILTACLSVSCGSLINRPASTGGGRQACRLCCEEWAPLRGHDAGQEPRQHTIQVSCSARLHVRPGMQPAPAAGSSTAAAAAADVFAVFTVICCNCIPGGRRRTAYVYAGFYGTSPAGSTGTTRTS
jgi:hypothetical protein